MGLFTKLTSLFTNSTTNTPPTSAKPTVQPKKILIAEDDKELRDFYQELLTSAGYTVLIAENGKIGLELLMSQKPDLAIIDLMMPIIDGKTMLHKMREIPEFQETPVIILTNAGDADNIRQTKFFDNADDFLIKSNITPDELLSRVKSFT